MGRRYAEAKWEADLLLCTLALWMLTAASCGLAESYAAFLPTSTDSARARYEIARDADEIYVATYILGDDETGRAALALLREQARQGKKVRLLVDTNGNRAPLAMLKYLSTDESLKGNFEVKLFNPFNWRRPLDYNQRSHVKLFITAKRGHGHRIEMITGGRNLRNDFFNVGRIARTPEERDQPGMTHHQRDADLYVSGPAALNGLAYFTELWKSPRSVSPDRAETPTQMLSRLRDWARHEPPSQWDRISAPELREAERSLDRAAEWLRSRPFVARAAGAHWRDKIDWIESIHFSGDSLTQRRSERDMIELINHAKKSVLIVNPFILPTSQLAEAIEQAVHRGVRVDAITSRISDIAPVLARAAFAQQFQSHLMRGMDLWFHDFPAQVHKKLVLADGESWYVGTFNLDPRSALWNLEQGVFGKGGSVAREIERQILRDRRGSRRLESGDVVQASRRCSTIWQHLGAHFFEKLL